jgi:hypothetical protein
MHFYCTCGLQELIVIADTLLTTTIQVLGLVSRPPLLKDSSTSARAVRSTPDSAPYYIDFRYMALPIGTKG